jgi:hypothetical protein
MPSVDMRDLAIALFTVSETSTGPTFPKIERWSILFLHAPEIVTLLRKPIIFPINALGP